MKKNVQASSSLARRSLRLIIALICFSGAMIEFAGEISEWAYHDRYGAQVSAQGRLPLPELVQRVEPHLEPGAP